MRFGSLHTLLFLPLLSLAASVQDEFVANAQANKGIVKLDAKSFERLTAADRTWSATVQFTALGSGYKCAPCRLFEPSYAAIAKAWTKAPAEHRNQHFFATLDFEQGAEVFKKLNLNSAPWVQTYPALKGSRRPSGKAIPIPYDFSNGFDADVLADSLNRHLPSPIPYSAPRNWTPIIGTTFAFFITAISAKTILPLFTNKWIWAIISIGTSLIMTSGLMFVRIRGNPYISVGRDGKAEWIAGGFQNQFGMETHVVSLIYGLLSLSCLSLVLYAPKLTSSGQQNAFIYIMSGVGTVVFAILLSFFRIKNPSYPYHLYL